MRYKHRHRVTTAVVPAAGRGTRLASLLEPGKAKEMLPLCGKPVIEHVMEELAASGIHDVLLVLSRDKIDGFRERFGRSVLGMTVGYILQRKQNGLAGAIYRAKEYVGKVEPFAVALGDTIIDTGRDYVPLRRMIDVSASVFGMVMVEKKPREELFRYGVVKPNLETFPVFRAEAIVEKPDPANAPSDFAIAGRYVFDPSVFDYIERTAPGAGGERQITDTIGLMLQDKRDIWCLPIDRNESMIDIGTVEAYEEAKRRFP